MKESTKLRMELDELFDVCLNGQYEVFNDSVEEYKYLLNDMSQKEIKSLKSKLNKRLEKI